MSITREQIVRELWDAAINAALLEAQDRPRRAPATGSDGEQTCRRCAPLAEQEATHRAENQLLVKGPVPAQEAAALVHLVKRAELARAKGEGTVKLYLPKEAEAANVSKATLTRALNKLRAADAETLPFTVADSWKNGKQHVAIVVPATIGDEDWTPRLAFLSLSRAQLAEERKKQGGSEAAVKARWSCPEHPEDAVIETTTRHYRCTVCDRSHAPPPIVRRIPGANDPMQVESGDHRDPVEIFGASFAATVTADPMQVDAVLSSIEEPLQVAAGAGSPRLIPVSFVSRQDQEAADSPHYWGDAPPKEPPAWQPPPLAPSHHRAWAFRPPSPPPFTPSADWQELPAGFPCPPGGELRMDFKTGKNWARWPAQEGVGS